MLTVNFKDTNGGTINVPNLRIAFSNMNSQPLSTTKERSRLHDSVNITTEPSNITVKIGNDKYFTNILYIIVILTSVI